MQAEMRRVVKDRRGFTIAEVIVALMILTVGVLAMMGTSASVNRLIVRGRRTTLATQLAEQVLDSLRRVANANLVACTGLTSNTTGYTRQAVQVTWTVGALTPNGNISERQVQAILSYVTAGRSNAIQDTVTTVIKCDI
jgi:prepilin-type N-terminal cleavage/methylation domain-containing protein